MEYKESNSLQLWNWWSCE